MTHWPRGQLDLLADQRLPAPMGPGAHRSDPPTSQLAAEAKRRSRSLETDQQIALSYIRSYPGRTCLELAEIALAEDRAFDAENGTDLAGRRGVEWHRQKIGRRLNELRRAGLIESRGTDGRSVRWWPVEST